MSPDLEHILQLQSLDTKTAEFEKEIAALPKHIAEIEKQLDSHKRRLDADRAALVANQKERKGKDDDIKVQQQKISKFRDQTLAAKTNEQYRAFQHEIEFCEKEIRMFEDRILDLMAESESLDANVKKAEAALAVEARQVEAEKKAAREKTAANQKQVAEWKAQRASIAALVRADYLTAYERIRKKNNGIAISEAVGDRCGACQMTLRPQVMQDLRKASAEGLTYCEYCRRILYYNAPKSFEDQV